MNAETVVTVTQAQANLPRLLKRDSFAVSRHGKVVGVFLSRDRMEALIESMELLASRDFLAALKEVESGRMKTFTLAELDGAMSA